MHFLLPFYQRLVPLAVVPLAVVPLAVVPQLPRHGRRRAPALELALALLPRRRLPRQPDANPLNRDVGLLQPPGQLGLQLRQPLRRRRRSPLGRGPGLALVLQAAEPR